jgi:hypothetical protein
MSNAARKWLPVVLIAAAVAGSAIVFARLPDEVSLPVQALLPFDVPTNNETGPRWLAVFLLPALAAIVWGGFQVGRATGGMRLARLLFRDPPPALTDPESFDRFRSAYDTITLWVVLLVLGFHAGFLASLLGAPNAAPTIITLVLGASMVAMGNVMPRLRPNLVAGIRTRRTLTDPALWRSTHRVFGFAFVISGLITMVVGLLAPAYGLMTGIGLLLISLLVGGFAAASVRREPPTVAAMLAVAMALGANVLQ